MNDNNRRVYVSDALNYVSDMSSHINTVAALLELSPEMVAGALAEEADTVFTLTGLDKTLNEVQDNYVPTLPHSLLEIDYTYITNAGLIDDKGNFDSLTHPVMADLGPDNIRLGGYQGTASLIRDLCNSC